MYNPITEIDIKQKEYLDTLEKCNCRLFPSYNLKEILFNETYYAICRNSNNIIKELIKGLMFNPSVISCDIKNRELLTFYTKNYRQDHDSYWEKICKDAGEHDDIKILRGKLKRFAPLSFFIKYSWYITAYNDMKCINNNYHRVYLALQLVARKWTLEKVKRMNLHPKVVMCFFDSSPDENVIMQYFKKIGAITITNQHGQSVFESFEYDRLNQSQLLNFKCDYFFAKGEKQKEQLIRAGVDENKIRFVGIVGDEKKYNYKLKKNDDITVIGIYLDCPAFSFAEITNYKMIDIIKNVASREGYKYFVKIHPADKIEKYKKVLDANCIAIYGKEKNISETFDDVSLAVISASSVYVDAYLNGIRCLKYDSEIFFPIAVKEDCFSDENDFVLKLINWEKMELRNKKKHIEKVYRLYNYGWRPGLVNSNINEIIMKSK